MKTTITLFIHQRPGEEQRALTCDLSEYGSYGALLGTREVEVEWETFDRDPVEALIDTLEQQVEKERADSQLRINALLDKIGKLRCIEHRPEMRA
jgi:hypothetical protein